MITGFVNSCDLAMNRTLRRRYMPAKKWSHWLKWLGARITGPVTGTLAVPIAASR